MNVITYIKRVRSLMLASTLVEASLLGAFGAVAHADGDYTITGSLSINGSPVTIDETGGIQFAADFIGSDNADHSGNVDTSGNYSVINALNDTYYAGLSKNDSNEVSGTTGIPDNFSLRAQSPTVSVNGSDTVKDFALTSDMVTTTVKDGNGNPVSGANVTVSQYAAGTITDGDGTTYTAGNVNSGGTTGTNGTVLLAVFPGLTYEVCMTTSNGNEFCGSNVTVSSNTSAEIDLPAAYTISGSVTVNGSPVPVDPVSNQGAQVAFGANDGNTGVGYTDASGNYAVNTMPNDIYSATVSYNNMAEDSAITRVPNNFSLGSPTTVTVNGANTTKSAAFNGAGLVTVTVKDAAGNPVSGANISIILAYPLGNTLATADGSETYNLENSTSTTTADANGIGTVAVFPGSGYEICATSPDNTISYCNQGLTITDGTSNTVNLPTASPTNLSAASPSQAPDLSWDAMPGAVSYNVYRNGALIANTASTSYTDSTIASSNPGINGYNVTAVDANGEESNWSNEVTVEVEAAPTINGESAYTTAMGSPFNASFNTLGDPTASLTESGALPNGITFTDNGDGTATLNGTPGPDSFGIYTFTVTASNSIGATSENVTMTVQ